MIDKTNLQYIDIWRKQEILKVRSMLVAQRNPERKIGNLV